MKTKISKRLIKKAEEITGDDTGYIEDLETLIDSARMMAYADWIIEVCNNNKQMVKETFRLINFYNNGDYEQYTKKAIAFYESKVLASTDDLEEFFKSL